MRPLLERPVSFRLSDEKRRQYDSAAAAAAAAAAAEQGLSISQYLRLRLDVKDHVAEQISQLRLALFDREDVEAPSNTLVPLLLELLLLARRQSAPADLRAVHHELERLGNTPWTPDRNIHPLD